MVVKCAYPPSQIICYGYEVFHFSTYESGSSSSSSIACIWCLYYIRDAHIYIRVCAVHAINKILLRLLLLLTVGKYFLFHLVCTSENVGSSTTNNDDDDDDDGNDGTTFCTVSFYGASCDFACYTERKAYQGNHLLFGRKANDVGLWWHGMHNADGNGAVDFGVGMQSFSLRHTQFCLIPK